MALLEKDDKIISHSRYSGTRVRTVERTTGTQAILDNGIRLRREYAPHNAHNGIRLHEVGGGAHSYKLATPETLVEAQKESDYNDARQKALDLLEQAQQSIRGGKRETDSLTRLSKALQKFLDERTKKTKS